MIIYYALALTASLLPVITQSFSLNQPAVIASHVVHEKTPRVSWKSTRTIPTFVQLSQSKNNFENENDDDDADDDDDDAPKSSRRDRNLGIDIGSQLEPLTASQAEKLRKEATDTINAAFDERMAEIEILKEQVRKDFETSREAMRFASDLRAAEQTEKLMDKIDRLSQDFLDKNQELRSGIKLAAKADSNMVGKGLEFGSWGQVGGMNVLTSVGGGGMEVTAGLLGSVGAARNGERDSVGDISYGTTESIIEVNTRVKGDGNEQRIMVICDESDKNFKKVLTRFEELVCDAFSDRVVIDTYKPSSVIPMGGNNAKCIILVSTSLSNGQASAENILGRVLKKTLVAGGGGVTKPPSHLVVVSPVGTERIEQFPYSMQNLMGGGKLKKAREVEEVVMSIVKRRFTADSSIPPLDYTILKLGELGEDSKILSGKDGLMNVKHGDTLDGKVGLEAAAQVLLQAVVMRPTARNATLSVVGGMDENQIVGEEMWEDWFLRLDGPELWRSEALAEGTQGEELARKFEELSAYINEWSNRYKDGAKGTGLITPVTVYPSKFSPYDTSSTRIRMKIGVRLDFKQTNTGSAYRSKDEERQVERETPSKSTSSKDQINSMRQKKQGGVEILVEEVAQKEGSSQLRVRAKRCNMDDDTVVKEMSEATIVKSLEEA
eukprot:CAMPEP_0176493726 /NCGR_PEP_ID=MMETSP0200_2-20121128/9700_1 /TAXON_ID=947934 /ORGANISM="Chaetoceros sp., Strain GSL56" /LENGTH=663 /DNA_ID=CAMNT_0017891403 /DNA_START=154 /DNA_END=2141 /DNA_ORIENTATION=+